MHTKLIFFTLLLMAVAGHAQELISFKENDKYGFKDAGGKTIIAPKYDGAESFSEGMCKVFMGKYPNTRYGFVDLWGKEIVSPVYEGAESFSEGLAPVKRNNKWGFIDKTGKLTIPLQYDHAAVFREGLAPVNIGGKIDNDGFFTGGKSGFIDKTGKVIIPLQYDKAKTFTRKGMAPVLLNGKWGLIDKTGVAVTGMNYNELDAMRLSVSDEIKNKYDKTTTTTTGVQQNTQVNTGTARVSASSEKELSNVFSKTFSYQREWTGKWTVSGEPTSQRQIAAVIFNVNKDEIKVYTANGNLEDTHTIQFSRYGTHNQYGKGKFYTAKSKKYNTVAHFIFFDNSSYGLLISWKDTYTQYLALNQ